MKPFERLNDARGLVSGLVELACTRCRQARPYPGGFYRARREKFSVTPWCKECHRERAILARRKAGVPPARRVDPEAQAAARRAYFRARYLARKEAHGKTPRRTATA